MADNKFEVVVVYNGVAKQVEVNPNQAVQALFQHALQAFGLQGRPQNLGLTLNGNFLDLNAKIKDVGIAPSVELHLRPRQTRGG